MRFRFLAPDPVRTGAVEVGPPGKDVRDLLSRTSTKINELDGQIAEARRDAEQCQLADDPYGS